LDNKQLQQELDQTKVAFESASQTKTKLELYVQNLEDQRLQLLEACKEKGLPTDPKELDLYIKRELEQLQVQADANKSLLIELSTVQADIQRELGIK
jgi:hypothetical protein